jgi:hypothetical protein
LINGTETFIFFQQLEEYSDEAHPSTVEAASEFSKTFPQTNPQIQHESSASEDTYAHHQNISNNLLNMLPDCPIIHWASQMFNDPKLYFCSCCINTELWRDQGNITIHHDHVCKGNTMDSE